MSKYDTRFKLKVVKQYESGKGGMKTLADRHGVDRAMVSRWVASYRKHGLAGLRKKFSRYTAPFKLSVLQRMRKEEWSCKQTQAWFDIRSPGQVAMWERQYHSGGLEALEPRPCGRPKKMPNPPVPPTQAVPPLPEDERTREQLLKENLYLRAEVAYLKKVDALIQAKRSKLQKKRK
jgi:transposase